MAFLDRARELAQIREILASERSELVVVYGRRGVGKSALLAEALSGRRHIYYQATTAALPQQLEDLTAAMRSFAPRTVLPGALPSLTAWLDAVSQLARIEQNPLALVIDELPYLAESEPAAPTILQRWWDRARREPPGGLKVFLLGSIVSWMEQQTLAESGPLHNRRTAQLLLEPLSCREASLFYPNYRPADRIAAYAIWGGLPSYLEEIDPKRPLWHNVRDRVLRPWARLADEPRWLRFSDLRQDGLYVSLLRAIAQGNRRPGKIALAVGRARADDVSFQLERLCDMGLVQRVVPITHSKTARTRQSLYVLADHYVAFWYRFVDPLRHLLAMRQYDQALASILEGFDEYVAASAFESVCRQFMWHALGDGRLPAELKFDSVGSWWTAKQDVQDELDVVAMNAGRTIVIGECKWSKKPCDVRDLAGLDAALRKGIDDLAPIDRPWRILFSRSGFTADLRSRAADPENRILLISLSDLYW